MKALAEETAAAEGLARLSEGESEALWTGVMDTGIEGEERGFVAVAVDPLPSTTVTVNGLQLATERS